MSLSLLDVGVVRPTLLARANPVAKLVVATVIALVLLVTVDPVTAGTALGLELVVLPWCGLSLRALGRRLALVLVGAVPTAVVTAWLGPDGGALVLGAGPLTVTTGSLGSAAAIGLRILAVAVPGVVLMATTDPTDLGDALAQVLHLPPRFVLAAVAAVRLLEVLAQEWSQLGLARRARGLGDDGVLGRVRQGAGQVFALLVLAVRRATVLATAMEARGFGASTRRTWARPSRMRPGDWAVVLGGTLVAAAATAAGMAAGTWTLVLR